MQQVVATMISTKTMPFIMATSLARGVAPIPIPVLAQNAVINDNNDNNNIQLNIRTQIQNSDELVDPHARAAGSRGQTDQAAESTDRGHTDSTDRPDIDVNTDINAEGG